MKKITAHDIDDFQKCSRKIWLKFFETSFKPEEASGFLQYLADQGNRFEKDCLDLLEEYHEPNSYEETILLMKQGVGFIYQAILEDEKRIGKADLLRRNNNNKSKFGNYSYDVIDIKSATLYSDFEETKPDKFKDKQKDLQKSYGLQLWHYYELLEEIQQTQPELYLWVRDREGYSEVKFQDSIIQSFKNRKPINIIYSDIMLNIDNLTKNDEVKPFKCSACNECEWKPFCMSQLEEKQHCSLIAGVQKRGLEDLSELGIETIEDFYNKVDYGTKIKYVLTGQDTSKTDKLKKQAQAILENKEFYLGEPLKPFDVDYLLFYDIEGEMGHEFEYLHGVWEVNTKTNEKRYISFISSEISEEGKIWQDFVSYIKNISKKGSFQIIYFADYERIAWRNLTEKNDTPLEDLKLLMNNSIDILKEWIQNKLILPKYNYSIKTVAPYYGFSWECKNNVYKDENGNDFKLDEANGGESIAWLDYWLSGKEYYKDIILDYNKDDVRATEWVYNEILKRYS